MNKKIFPVILTIVFLIIFFIFFKGLQNSNIYTPNVNLNKGIPVFESKSLDDNLINSDEVINEKKYYLINIWASWCVPCKDEHPFLMQLSKEKKIKIIGLNYKDTKRNALNFLDKLGNPYHVNFFDKDGTIAIEWGAYGVPESFLVYDRKIIKKIIGPLNTDLFMNIKELIK